MDIPVESSTKLVFYLLIGTLSVYFTEVFAGSSPLWFMDPWGILMVFPLYFMHLIFFLNIAIRIKRTSVSHLYLFGVIFGLYESWITKVLWTGYPGAGAPIMGTVCGIALLEFSVLVFFWHPIFAFVLPILVFEVLTLPNDSIGDGILPSHLTSLKKNRRILAFLTFAILLGASFLSINTGHNVAIADLAILGNLSIIFLLYRIARRKQNAFSISSLQLKKKGLTIVTIYLILLYVLSFLLLVPDKTPTSPLPVLIIIGFYAFIAFLIKMSPVHETTNIEANATEGTFSTKSFFVFCLLHLLLTTIFCIVPQIGLSVAFALNIVLYLGGPFLFACFVVGLLFRKRENTHTKKMTDSYN